MPRTLPSGPELSKTRLMMFPPEGRGVRFLFRDRDLDDLIDMLSSLWQTLRRRCIAQRRVIDVVALECFGN
jgi:hypothetical protein